VTEPASRASLETMVGTSLSIIAVFAAVAALIAGWRAQDGRPALLVYDRDYIADQSVPYIEAGQDPMAVIDAAVRQAAENGFIVIDARLAVRAPDDARFRLDRFVAVGSAVGRTPPPLDLSLPGTAPVQKPDPAASPAAGAAPIGGDVADVARQIGTAAGRFSPAPARE
jgi:hypothetical protein